MHHCDFEFIEGLPSLEDINLQNQICIPFSAHIPHIAIDKNKTRSSKSFEYQSYLHTGIFVEPFRMTYIISIYTFTTKHFIGCKWVQLLRKFQHETQLTLKLIPSLPLFIPK